MLLRSNVHLLLPYLGSLTFLIVFYLSGSDARRTLQCHRCISWSCPANEEFCGTMKDFAKRQLMEYFYFEYKDIPDCPPEKGAETIWDEMRYSSPSNIACPEIVVGEATCALGRFQVITSHSPTGSNLDSDLINVTSHGTIMGCAKRKLLQATRETLSQPNQLGCALSLLNSSSYSFSSYKHRMQLEFCPIITDLCHHESFCIKPESSIVKTFKDHTYVPNLPIGIFIIFAIILGIIICLLTFAGIKYS